MKHLLLVEDDQDFGKMLKRYLELNKFTVTWALHGAEAYAIIKNQDFDLCIIDVMMPVMDGFTLADKIANSKPETPFLFLTARKTKEDRIKGLKLGADDYIVKPFEAEELLLRLKNIIKRAAQQKTEVIEIDEEMVSLGAYMFDYSNLTLTINNKSNTITEKEAKLLYYLYKNRNTLLRRDEILLKVWGKTDFFSGRSMDVFVSRIRKHLKEDPTLSIESVRGIGLQFNLDN
ncbi:response regulator transcription factor [Rasiella rasia]|uniref:Response regulator transcription factor n=1 Tax=Rasiella rasia TaxID=2744027 RepID=A0A6G6GIK4_9FLAO|nr:response regulator transcription factor [Rasiella rasia]QIE58379.1 response regulator transcription factor [Rasiella rasia]